jgi:hypothetical protein
MGIDWQESGRKQRRYREKPLLHRTAPNLL